MTFYLILSLSAFLLSLLGTRVSILAARKHISSIDRYGRPKRAIPGNGGIVLVMSLVICLLIADINYIVVLSLFLLAAISLLNEIIAVPAIVRALIYLIAVLLPLSLIRDPVFSALLPLWLDKAITAILWMWCIYAFNVMDGVDGITPTEMICIATGLALIVALTGVFPSALSVYCLVVMSAACGFFWWNWYPAKILLGEVGSAPIGFLIGYLLLMAIASGYGYAAAILPAYYLSDATITLYRKLSSNILAKGSPFQHYYQLAVRNGRSHESVVRYIFGANLILILLATFSVIYPELSLLCVIIAYSCAAVMLGFFAYTPHNPDHEPF